VLILLSCGASIVGRTQRDGMQHFLATQTYQDVYYLPPPEWLPLFSLGHREALADLIWLRSLIYFAEELGQRGEVAHLYAYADAMLALDERFKKVYSWVAACAIYRTGTVTNDDVTKAIGYLERAIRLFPDDGNLAWAAGGNYLYELAPHMPDGPAKDEVRRKGIEHLTVAARMGAGPPWLALTTATELNRLGQHEREIEHLQDLYDKVSDPMVRGEVEARLAQLRDQAFAEAFRRTYDEQNAERSKHFPYLDPGLYMLVGAKPAFDGGALLQRGFDPDAPLDEP
jgi:tetratricopeptide (TPR) repeat protein